MGSGQIVLYLDSTIIFVIESGSRLYLNHRMLSNHSKKKEKEKNHRMLSNLFEEDEFPSFFNISNPKSFLVFYASEGSYNFFMLESEMKSDL